MRQLPRRTTSLFKGNRERCSRFRQSPRISRHLLAGGDIAGLCRVELEALELVEAQALEGHLKRWRERGREERGKGSFASEYSKEEVT